MAKIHEQKITLTLSQLKRDDEITGDAILTDENLAAVLEAVQALVGETVLIEVE